MGAMPSSRPDTNQRNTGGEPPIGAPSLKMSEMPSSMPAIASVTMIGDNLKSTIMNPFRKPIARPITSASGTAQ